MEEASDEARFITDLGQPTPRDRGHVLTPAGRALVDAASREDRLMPVLQSREPMPPRQITPCDLWIIIGASFSIGVILTASVLLGVIR